MVGTATTARGMHGAGMLADAPGAAPAPGPGLGAQGPGVGLRAGRLRGDDLPEGRVLAVVGAVGGAGTSVVCAALAHGLRRAGERATLVDLDGQGPGLEMLLGIDDVPGVRWGDLDAARGEVDGVALVSGLPRWGVVPVLGGRPGGAAPDDAVVLDVCAGLVRAGETLVLDLPRPGAGAQSWRAAAALVGGADVVLVVAPLTVPAAAGAMAVVGALREAGATDVRMVVRGPAPGRVDGVDLAEVLGLPVVAELGRDRWLAAAVERGEGPPMGRRTPLGRFATHLAGAL